MKAREFTENLPSTEDWWKALRWVMLVFSLVVLLTMAGSFFSYQDVVQSGHPWIPKFTCRGCVLCGMTRSFCAMSAGCLDDAFRWNRGGPFLYSAGWLWTAAFLIFCANYLKNLLRIYGRATARFLSE